MDLKPVFNRRIESARSGCIYCLLSLFIILLLEVMVLFAHLFKLFDWLATYSAMEKLNSFQLFRAELQRFRWRTIYCLDNSCAARNISSSGKPAKRVNFFIADFYFHYKISLRISMYL